jgi:hypothetical protein
MFHNNEKSFGMTIQRESFKEPGSEQISFGSVTIKKYRDSCNERGGEQIAFVDQSRSFVSDIQSMLSTDHVLRCPSIVSSLLPGNPSTYCMAETGVHDWLAVDESELPEELQHALLFECGIKCVSIRLLQDTELFRFDRGGLMGDWS